MWESSQINGAQTKEQSKDVLILEAIFIIWDTKLFLKHLFMFLGKSFIRQNAESVPLGTLEKSPKFWRPWCLQLKWEGGTAWYPRSLGLIRFQVGEIRACLRSTGPSKHIALCDCSGYMSVKPSLLPVLWRWKLSSDTDYPKRQICKYYILSICKP